MKNNIKNLNTHAWKLSFIAAGVLLVGCGGGGNGTNTGTVKLGNESVVCTQGTTGYCTLYTLQWVPYGGSVGSVNYRIYNATKGTNIASGTSEAVGGSGYIYGSSVGQNGNALTLGAYGDTYKVDLTAGGATNTYILD